MHIAVSIIKLDAKLRCKIKHRTRVKKLKVSSMKAQLTPTSFRWMGM